MAVTIDPTVGFTGNQNDPFWPFTDSTPKADPTGGATGGGGQHKPGDTYRDEYGQFVTMQPDGSVLPYRAPAQSAGDTSAQIDGAGVPYISTPKGFMTQRNGQLVPYDPAPLPVNPHPGSSFSSSTSQSFQDPAVLAETIRQNNATIARWAVQDALAAQQQQYLERKDAWAQKNSDAQLALSTQTQLATIQNQRDILSENIRQANQRSAEAQQAMQEHVAEFNSTQKLATDTANAQFADRSAQRLQQVNADIGTLGADSGDRGKWASFVTANSGWGKDNTGVPGANLITDESAKPLENSLQTRQNLLNQNNAPFTFNPIQLESGPLSAASILTQAKQAGFQGDVGTTFGTSQQQLEAADRYLKQGSTPVAAQPAATPAAPTARDDANTKLMANFPGGVIPKGLADAGLTGFEDGGASVDSNMLMTIAAILDMEPKAIAGEKGKANGETVLSNGDVVIIPDKGKLASKQKKMATGGLNLAGSPLATQFLSQASTKARSGTPWAGGGVLPSPVYESSPGTDPGFAALLDSIRALEQGVPVDYSQRLAAKYRPTALSERLVGRSA